MDAITPPKPKVLFEGQPFIPYVKEEDFDPRLKPVVEPYKKRMGFLPNALKLYAYRPEIAETLWRLNSNIMRDPSSTLDQRLKRGCDIGVAGSLTAGQGTSIAAQVGQIVGYGMGFGHQSSPFQN